MPAEDFTRSLDDSLEGLRIGVPTEFFGEGLAADVRAAIDAALAEYQKLGAKLVEISLPRTELSIPVYYIIAPAEASSNLSRFDGVKFGHRAKPLRRSARHVQEDPRRRLRRRGQAPHHDRHLRAVARLLRRLLPAGAEDPPHDRRRFPAGLQAVRRDRRAGGAHGGLEARRTRRRPGGRLPGRHLHAARVAGRPARHERAVRLRRRPYAGRPAIDRQLLRRGEAAQRRAPLPAGDRFPPPHAGGRTRH